MKRIFYFLKRFLIGILNFLFDVFTLIFVALYKLITYEPGKKNVLTIRKIKRIRRITKYKIYLYEHFPNIVRKLNLEDYFIDLKKRLSYGV